LTDKILIVGAGPAGIFCAEELLKLGREDIIIIDSGKPMHERRCPQTKECNCPRCDILEGGGGAGGFSDGKMTLSLNRGTQTELIFSVEHESILDEIDEVMVEHGGEGIWYNPVGEPPEEFLRAGFRFDSYPLRHFGSDGAQRMIKNQIASLQQRGVKFEFHKIADRIIRNFEGRAVGIVAVDGTMIMAGHIVIATGLQGTPWLEAEAERIGIELTPGPAGIGMRLETAKENLAGIFEIFYDFKLELDCPIGTLRSFCCNREGYIVNENHQSLMIRNVNGHSNLSPKLRSNSSNFAIIAKVEAAQTYPFSPQEWVRKVAKDINTANSGRTVSQFALDFLTGEPSDAKALNKNPVRTNTQSATGTDISGIMPPELRRSFRKFLVAMDTALDHGLGASAVVYAPEIKYYASRFPIDENWKSLGADGLYVVGNASGYLDSYVAAAVSGVIAARDIVEHEVL